MGIKETTYPVENMVGIDTMPDTIEVVFEDDDVNVPSPRSTGNVTPPDASLIDDSSHKGSEPRHGLVASIAARYEMDPKRFQKLVLRSCFRGQGVAEAVTAEDLAAFLLICKVHNLNPITREIFAFKSPSDGSIHHIVSVDGWIRIINEHPQFDGVTFENIFDDEGALVSITATIYRRDRAHPVSVVEFMSECLRNTKQWERWPTRMLRHKALIQCARIAFGFAGIVDQDEYERREEALAWERDNPKDGNLLIKLDKTADPAAVVAKALGTAPHAPRAASLAITDRDDADAHTEDDELDKHETGGASK